ncbi:phosphoglycerate dehydrogenase [Reichenbachiella faecimaris]|nr:phosphoglycerate dehydrogenase [Reichenbachiella faecimaris]
MKGIKVAVTTVAFSKNEQLVNQLNQSGFESIKTNTAGKRFERDELIDYLSDCDAAIVGLDKIDDELLKMLPKLKVISKYGVGLDNIDLKSCESRDITVLHTQGVNRRSVSEMALGFMICLSRNLYTGSNELKLGLWNKNGGQQISGKTIGIIGVGNIGKDLIALLKPFNCTILVNDIIDQADYYAENNLEEVSKSELIRRSDIISIHTPLTEETMYLINKDRLAEMKPSAIVINTARGGIINQNDLKNALKNKLIAGAAIDAYETEPPEDSDLLAIPNLMNTPHIGGNAREAVIAMGHSAIDNLTKFYRKN